MKLPRQRLDLLWYMVVSSARTETRQLYAGVAWWLLEPLLYMSVMYLVFGVILRHGGPGYVGFLLVGFVYWRWNDSSVKRASQSLLGARAILTQTSLPPPLFPLADVLSVFLRFLAVLALLTLFAAWYSGRLGAAYAALPPVLLLNLAFVYCLGLCLGLLVPFVPDLRNVIDNAMQLLFFASGIFYDINTLEPAIASVLHLNPFAAFISVYRGIMLEGSLPGAGLLAVPVAATALLAVAAVVCQLALRRRLANALLRS